MAEIVKIAGKTNAGLVEYAKEQLGLPYWYGTYGQTATEALYLAKKKQYPKQYTALNFPLQYGKRVHDCVGLIKGYEWSATPTSAPVYNKAQDTNANGMYAYSSHKGKNMSEMPDVAGMLVFKTNKLGAIHHVGVYIGNGYVIEAKGHAYGVVKSRITDGWSRWAECPWIEYSKGDKTVNIEMLVLKKGAKGDEVKTLQYLLDAYGYAGADGRRLEKDGSFGDNTELAVKLFQKDSGLSVDGSVGSATWTALLK